MRPHQNRSKWTPSNMSSLQWNWSCSRSKWPKCVQCGRIFHVRLLIRPLGTWKAIPTSGELLPMIACWIGSFSVAFYEIQSLWACQLRRLCSFKKEFPISSKWVILVVGTATAVKSVSSSFFICAPLTRKKFHNKLPWKYAQEKRLIPFIVFE